MSEKTWPNWNSITASKYSSPILSIHVWEDVAQLKQYSHNTDWRSHTSIHVWEDVAQLKLSCMMWLRQSIWSIHVWEDVAQLKLPYLKIHSYHFLSIHVWEDVAQLKQVKAWNIVIGKGFLSMSEKTWPNWNSFIRYVTFTPDVPIHVWEDVAQLKPSQFKLCRYPPQIIYPCLRRRGPIETILSDVFHMAPDRPIHVWEDVAQLKPRDFFLSVLLILAIHVWEDVAQLKLLSGST